MYTSLIHLHFDAALNLPEVMEENLVKVRFPKYGFHSP